MNDLTLHNAILNKRCLTGTYEGLTRHFAPHALGRGPDGARSVFVFQYAGESAGGLPSGGDWRCFRVAGLSALHANDARWRSRSNYSLDRQSCLVHIEVAVPTSS
jgi:hypothetical protein